MDSGLAAIIGSAVGGISTFAATWLNGHLNRNRSDRSEKAARAILKDLLEDEKWRWRRLETLANVVGTDEATVRRLLLEVGARGAMNNGRYWGLTSRNPLGEADPEALEDPAFSKWKVPFIEDQVAIATPDRGIFDIDPNA